MSPHWAVRRSWLILQHWPLVSTEIFQLFLQRCSSLFTQFTLLLCIQRRRSEKHKSGSEVNNFLSPAECQKTWRFWGHFNNRHQYSALRTDRRRADQQLQAERTRLKPRVISVPEPRRLNLFWKISPCSALVWWNASRHFMLNRCPSKHDTRRNTSVL